MPRSESRPELKLPTTIDNRRSRSSSFTFNPPPSPRLCLHLPLFASLFFLQPLNQSRIRKNRQAFKDDQPAERFFTHYGLNEFGPGHHAVEGQKQGQYSSALLEALGGDAGSLQARMERFGPPPPLGTTLHSLRCNSRYNGNGALSATVAGFDRPCGSTEEQGAAPCLFHHRSTKTLRLVPMFSNNAPAASNGAPLSTVSGAPTGSGAVGVRAGLAAAMAVDCGDI